MYLQRNARLLCRSAVVAVLLGSSGVALAASVAIEAGNAVVADAGVAKAARIGAILDRWTPVVHESGQDVALWRDMISIQLSQASDTVLAKLAEMDPSAVVKGVQKDRTELYKTFISTLGSDTAARYAAKPGNQKVLGSVNIDQVYTPITPCRIVDTRNVGGPIVAGETRNFYFWSISSSYNFGNQGGISGSVGTVCPAMYFNSAAGTGSDANIPSAAMITVTVVSPSAAGNWVLWGGANPIPTISALNWNAGDIATNTTVVPYGGRAGTGPGGGILDFAVFYNGPSGNAQFVADVVGYYTPPFGTALSCVETAQNSVACAGGGGQCSQTPPACPTGYNNTAINCDTDNYFTFNAGFNIGTCFWKNTNAGATTGFASRHCCRVDGR
ncbi:MAG TPA: hypothetical protein VGL25_13915 [Casimicrobiaceae bacterium]|jgi:hypothetical protein